MDSWLTENKVNDFFFQSPTWDSENPTSTRYMLDYKKIPYRLVPLEYPNLESKLKELGLPPCGVRSDGSGHYICPSIVHEETGIAISDPYQMAEYFDKAFPGTPPVLPPGTKSLQAAFYDQFDKLLDDLWLLMMVKIPYSVLNPESSVYFTCSRAASYGAPFEETAPQGEARKEAWTEIKEAFDLADGWIKKSSGPYFGGDTPIFSDFAIGGFLHFIRRVSGEDSKEWISVKKWNGGRWKLYLDGLDKLTGTEI